MKNRLTVMTKFGSDFAPVFRFAFDIMASQCPELLSMPYPDSSEETQRSYAMIDSQCSNAILLRSAFDSISG
jgi:hypothetical protein